jgi:hypothetical protein
LHKDPNGVSVEHGRRELPFTRRAQSLRVEVRSGGLGDAHGDDAAGFVDDRFE